MCRIWLWQCVSAALRHRSCGKMGAHNPPKKWIPRCRAWRGSPFGNRWHLVETSLGHVDQRSEGWQDQAKSWFWKPLWWGMVCKGHSRCEKAQISLHESWWGCVSHGGSWWGPNHVLQRQRCSYRHGPPRPSLTLHSSTCAFKCQQIENYWESDRR